MPSTSSRDSTRRPSWLSSEFPLRMSLSSIDADHPHICFFFFLSGPPSRPQRRSPSSSETDRRSRVRTASSTRAILRSRRLGRPILTRSRLSAVRAPTTRASLTSADSCTLRGRHTCIRRPSWFLARRSTGSLRPLCLDRDSTCRDRTAYRTESSTRARCPCRASRRSSTSLPTIGFGRGTFRPLRPKE